MIELDAISRLELKPGEALAITLSPGWSRVGAQNMIENLRRLLSEHGLDWPILVFPHGVGLHVVDASETATDG